MSVCLELVWNNERLCDENLPEPVSPPDCKSQCQCGYVLFESFEKYLPEIANRFQGMSRAKIEARLREQILEASRLLDLACEVEPGFFSKAHYNYTQTVIHNGDSRFMRVPPLVQDSGMTVVFDNCKLVSSSLYKYQNGYLIFNPCVTDLASSCSPGDDCVDMSNQLPAADRDMPWPRGCYQITARWGNECADLAVRLAVRSYILELYRTVDPQIALQAGFPVFNRSFPPEWKLVVEKHKGKNTFINQWAIA